MVITGTLGYALFKAPIIILRAMVKPKLQLRRKSTAVNNDNSQLSSRSSRGTKQLCKLYCFSFSPIIYGNAIADKMGVSTVIRTEVRLYTTREKGREGGGESAAATSV